MPQMGVEAAVVVLVHLDAVDEDSDVRSQLLEELGVGAGFLQHPPDFFECWGETFPGGP